MIDQYICFVNVDAVTSWGNDSTAKVYFCVDHWVVPVNSTLISFNPRCIQLLYCMITLFTLRFYIYRHSLMFSLLGFRPRMNCYSTARS